MYSIMNIAEDLGQILVVCHTLLVIIVMPPRLNKQSGRDRTFIFVKKLLFILKTSKPYPNLKSNSIVM